MEATDADLAPAAAKVLMTTLVDGEASWSVERRPGAATADDSVTLMTGRSSTRQIGERSASRAWDDALATLAIGSCSIVATVLR